MTNLSEQDLHNLVSRIVAERLSSAADQPGPHASSNNPYTARTGAKIVAIGSDHGGFALKALLIRYLAELGYEVLDCGTHDTSPVDYPDFAKMVALQVANGSAWRGVMIDGAGIGSCMTANKVPGIRASMCYDVSTASNAREHNDANVLTLGAGLIGENLAKQIVKTWLSTEFGGGRHQPRIAKIMAVEKEYMK